MNKDLIPTNTTDWLSAVKLSDTPLLNFIGKGIGDQRLTDEPPPEKPAWLMRRQVMEDMEKYALESLDHYSADEDYDDDFDEYRSPINILRDLGYTVDLNPPEGGILPPMTDEQEAEREAYAQEYLEWNRRNPVIEKPKRNLTWGFSR